MNISLGEVSAWCGGKTFGGETARLVGVSTDTRTLGAGELFVAIRGPQHDGHTFLEQAASRGAAALLVECGTDAPGSVARIEVDDPVAALGEIAHGYRKRFTGPVVAITGSNGKTTTKEMCAEILEAAGHRVRRSPGNLNNAIGLPLSILRLDEGDEALVVELGMNHPGEIDHLAQIAAPTVASITQVARAHLEGLGSIEAIGRAKGELLDHLAEGGTAVLNADDPNVVAQERRFRGRKLWFGVGTRADFRGRNLRTEGTGTGFRLTSPIGTAEIRIPLPGLHLVGLALCAIASAYATGGLEETGLDAATVGLAAFSGVPGRLRLVRGGPGIMILDDTYNSNPASAAAALRALRTLAGDRRAIAVLGDMLELGEEEQSLHREIGEELARLQIEVLIAVGSRSRETAVAARAGGVGRVETVTNSDEAATLIGSIVERGDSVLLKGSRGMRMERALSVLRKKDG